MPAANESERPWLTMTAGAEAIERPHDLLADLIRDVGPSNPMVHSDPERIEGYEISNTGWYGSETAGYRWREWREADSNEYIGCTIETYGLNALALTWAFSLRKSGYAYDVHHGELRVRFASDDDQRRFALFWHAKAGRRPVFA